MFIIGALEKGPVGAGAATLVRLRDLDREVRAEAAGEPVEFSTRNLGARDKGYVRVQVPRPVVCLVTPAGRFRHAHDVARQADPPRARAATAM